VKGGQRRRVLAVVAHVDLVPMVSGGRNASPNQGTRSTLDFDRCIGSRYRTS
jgi:hypothetical protein